MTHPAAELIDVHKSYGAIQALAGVSLQLNPGEILALLGPNGAGKSTAVSLLTGLRPADAGQVRLFGADPRQPAARAAIGATPQDSGFPLGLTVAEVTRFVCRHYPQGEAPAALLDRFGLTPLAKRRGGALSGGQRRMLSVALAFAGKPRAVFLDEPTTGLDIDVRRRLWDAVRDYRAQGGAVLLTTHYLEEADQLADRVAVIGQGRVLADGTTASIRAQVGLRRVRLRAAALPPLGPIARQTLEDGIHTLYSADSDALVRALVASGAAFSELEILPATLEDAFRALTGNPGASA
jgi:ABC-2 type transport system ATP-binding protein